MMLHVGRILAAIVLSCPVSVWAAGSGNSQAAPMERATEQIKRNLENNPDNPGLERALDRLRINQIRQSDRSNGGGSDVVSPDAPGDAASPAPSRVERRNPVTRPRPERVQAPALPARANRPERPLLRRVQ
jgi:hypothetical protein